MRIDASSDILLTARPAVSANVPWALAGKTSNATTNATTLPVQFRAFAELPEPAARRPYSESAAG